MPTNQPEQRDVVAAHSTILLANIMLKWDSVPSCVGKNLRLAKKGLWGHPVSEKQTGGPRAHEYHRTRMRFCPEAQSNRRSYGFGLA